MFHSKLSEKTVKDTLLYAKKDKSILFLGICGMGMSTLARLLKKEGYRVIGYDTAPSGEHRRLLFDGIPVFTHECGIDLTDVALIVYTLAMRDDHPLLCSDIPQCSRAQLLGALMDDYPIRIAIAGTHGKSTVTSLVHRALCALGEHPTTLSGADLGDGEGPLSIGEKKILLYECCEYKNSFLYTKPSHALLLNLELDHTDFFPTVESLEESFLGFASLAEHTVYLASDKGLSRIAQRLPQTAHPYYLVDLNTEGAPSFPYAKITFQQKEHYTYTFHTEGEAPVSLAPTVGGLVGVYNTLGALSLLTELSYDPHRVAEILSTLPPIARRMELLGWLGTRPLYYDFAHHPTEISSTVSTLTQRHGTPPTLIFAPHTYTRTRDLWDGFVSALSTSPEVYLAPITSAREAPIEGVTSERLATEIGACAHPLSHLVNNLDILLKGSAPIVLMGAGDLREIKDKIQKMQTFLPIKE